MHSGEGEKTFARFFHKHFVTAAAISSFPSFSEERVSGGDGVVVAPPPHQAFAPLIPPLHATSIWQKSCILSRLKIKVLNAEPNKVKKPPDL